MPINKFALARYQVIDTLLRKNKYVKTKTIVQNCEEQLGFKVSQRTIQLDITSMKHDNFLNYFAPIGYCKKQKAFYYENKNYQLSPFCFSKEEYEVILMVFNLCKDLIPDEYSELFKNIIFKIELNIC